MVSTYFETRILRLKKIKRLKPFCLALFKTGGYNYTFQTLMDKLFMIYLGIGEARLFMHNLCKSTIGLYVYKSVI